MASVSSSPGSTLGAGATGVNLASEMSEEKVASAGKAASVGGWQLGEKKKQTTKQQPQNTSLLASQAQAVINSGGSTIVQAGIGALGRGQLLE